MEASNQSKQTEDAAQRIVPTVQPRPGKPGRATRSLKQFETYLNGVRRMKFCSFFLHPVDVKDCAAADYYEVIKQPMDLTTISMRLKNGYYYSVTEAFADMQQLLKNCFQYNNIHDACYKCGLQLKRSFELNLLSYPDVEELLSGRNRVPVVVDLPTPPPHVAECRNILDALEINCPKSVPFFTNPYGQTTIFTGDRYTDIITNPMNLVIVKKKLTFLLYKDLAEFVDDIRLIYLNGLKTYQYTDKRFAAAGVIRTLFEGVLSFTRSEGRLPTDNEILLINKPWKLISLLPPECAPERITFKVENGIMTATFPVKDNESLKLLKKFEELADETEELKDVRDAFENICRLEMEERKVVAAVCNLNADDASDLLNSSDSSCGPDEVQPRRRLNSTHQNKKSVLDEDLKLSDYDSD